MKKNLLSWLMLVVVLALTVSACTKKEQPSETAMPAMEDMDASAEDAASAAKTDLDEDIFDLDPVADVAGDMVSDATEQAQDAMPGLLDQATSAAQAVTNKAVVAVTDAAAEAKKAAAAIVPTTPTAPVPVVEETVKKAEATATSVVAAVVPATKDQSKPA